MEAYEKAVLVVIVLMVGIGSDGGVVRMLNAQSICNVPIAGLTACRPAVTPPKPSPPSPTCCAALSGANFKCLCSYKNSSLLPSLGIDPNLALQLPAKCKLRNPPNC
ncbi:hypothetical protein U1Q18_030535 [Sarracenia purpurea var. burkii]